MLASKAPFPTVISTSASNMPPGGPQTAMPPRRVPVPQSTGQAYASPTESEFSDSDGPDSVKNWDEDSVCEYLRSVKCGEYEKLFRKNHINGENLLEMDKEVLKEMGIEKVGDRVRLFLGIKKLRTKAYANQKKRNRVRLMNDAWHVSGSQANHCIYRTHLAGWIFRSNLRQLPPRDPRTAVLHP